MTGMLISTGKLCCDYTLYNIYYYNIYYLFHVDLDIFLLMWCLYIVHREYIVKDHTSHELSNGQIIT